MSDRSPKDQAMVDEAKDPNTPMDRMLFLSSHEAPFAAQVACLLNPSMPLLILENPVIEEQLRWIRQMMYFLIALRV